MMEAVLIAIQTFFDTLAFEAQRDLAPDTDPPYVRWDALDMHRDDGQGNYADEEYGQQVFLTVDCWGETGVEAAETFDALKTAFKTTPINPTGMKLLRRPVLEFSRPMRDPDTRHHRVASRWYLQFTPA